MACPVVAADLADLGASNYYPFYLALEPDGSHLWAYIPNLSSYLLHRLTWPGLSVVDTVPTRFPEGMVMRGDGTLFWVEQDAAFANFEVRRDQSSPTTIATFSSGLGNVMLGYSPYDDNLWLIHDPHTGVTPNLYRIDPDTGATTFVRAIAGSRVGSTAALSPTLDGGLWVPSGSGSAIFTRYDIPSDTVQQTGIANIHTPIPQPDDTVWYFRSSFGRERDAAFVESLQPCMDGLSSHSSVAWMQDLSVVVFGRVLQTQLWQIGDLPVSTAHWRIGRIGWPT